MTEELKPCPFCGGSAKIGNGDAEFCVYCPHCGAQVELCETEDEAIKEWNDRSCRACKSGTDEEIKRLEAENARLQKELNDAIEQNYKNAYDIQQQAARGAKYAQKENNSLREALKSCCNEFNRGNWLYGQPPCGKCGTVDAEGHCTKRKFCRVYAEIMKWNEK